MSEAAPGLVGLFGGTFNPIHLGHLRAAEEVREALGLSQVRFVPSARPPHKRGSREQIAPPEARLEWVRLAVAGSEGFEADPIEVERDGPSFLVDTLTSFNERLAPERPVFVLGRDAFQEMSGWRAPETLLELAHFAVTTRPPAGTGRIDEWLPETLLAPLEVAPDGQSARHSKSGTWIRLLEITPLEISASAIRDRLRMGRSVRYLLPEAAHDAIVSSGYYDGSSAAEESDPR
jgi:nicotinate-nucleotide adenylyltransferase